MTEGPLVSVIMIFLNEEKFIEQAIRSVSDQTYGNWELLLVDDGSVDDSTSIAKRHALQDPEKIRYLDHPGHANRGMSASRNLGIGKSRGAFITFIDADDVVYPEKLERQITLMCSHPDAALVCGRAQWWYSWTGNQENVTRDFVQVLDVELDTVVQPPTLLTLFLQDEWASLCDVMVRKEAVESIGGYEESFKGMYEDQVFHSKLCLKFPAFVASEVWYRYRQHPHACSSVSHESGQYVHARQKFLNWLEGYFGVQGDSDIQLWKILRQEIWGLRHPFLRGIIRRIRHIAFALTGKSLRKRDPRPKRNGETHTSLLKPGSDRR
jgi:glycosyltransferase involved in cell wall biosynthesis